MKQHAEYMGLSFFEFVCVTTLEKGDGNVLDMASYSKVQYAQHKRGSVGEHLCQGPYLTRDILYELSRVCATANLRRMQTPKQSALAVLVVGNLRPQ